MVSAQSVYIIEVTVLCLSSIFTKPFAKKTDFSVMIETNDDTVGFDKLFFGEFVAIG
jgi:hypothetical protein